MNRANAGEKVAHIEIPYEGDHCLPCVYMVEAVEEAVKKFGDRVRWERVHLKRRNGAMRYAELSVKIRAWPLFPPFLLMRNWCLK